jgi:hypothetical protein
VLSFVTITIILLSPHIAELKIAGIDVKLSGNARLLALLTVAVAYETATYYIRFYNNYFGGRLTKIGSKCKDIEISISTMDENEWHNKNNTSTSVDFEVY